MDVVPFLCGFAGFMAGLLVWGRTIRWAYALWTVSREQQRDPAQRSRWRLVGAVLLHSGPWMLAALLGTLVVILPRPHLSGWDSFFYGVLASLVFQGLMMSWVFYKLRARRGKGRGKGS